MNIEDEIQFMKNMMTSCYTYGSIEKDSYYYKDYLEKWEVILGKDLFEKVYQQQKKELSAYKVVRSVYTDSEGLTYNSLEPKQD